MRGAWLAVCMAALACGSSPSTPNDGGGDTRPAGTCDLLAQTGCANGLKCDLACDLTTGSTVTLCDTAGPHAAGEGCAANDPCMRGSICATVSGQGAACRKLCAGPGDCPTGTTCDVRPVTFCGPGLEVGLCL